jgi:hypothetical protein
MMDMIVWGTAISVIVLSIINKDTLPAVWMLLGLLAIALAVFTYQIIFNEKVPGTYYGYLSFSSFVAVMTVLLFFLNRTLNIKELRNIGMMMVSFCMIVMSLIMLSHQFWGYGRVSYFHLLLLLAGVFFYILERWDSITVFKILAIIFANACCFYLVYNASKMEGGLNYANLSQSVVMRSGLLATCILFFAYYLLRHNIISEKHANRFLGVGVSLMAAGSVYLHPEATEIAFKPFHGLKGLLAIGDLSAVAYGVGITVFAKAKIV